MKTINNIVLLDDNKIDCFINQKICSLTFENATIKTFNSSTTALDYFTAQYYIKEISRTFDHKHLLATDLILLDINMPVMNGFEFLKELAKFDAFTNKPIDVFFLSSSNNENDMKYALETKFCSGYLTKPLTKDKLKMAMELNHKKGQHAAYHKNLHRMSSYIKETMILNNF